MPVCLLVRHGRTTANAEGILAGWMPGIELDEHGREQVEALAQRLRGLPLRDADRQSLELLLARSLPGRASPAPAGSRLPEAR